MSSVYESNFNVQEPEHARKGDLDVAQHGVAVAAVGAYLDHGGGADLGDPTVSICHPQRPHRGLHPSVQRPRQQDGPWRRQQTDELLHKQHNALIRQGDITTTH